MADPSLPSMMTAEKRPLESPNHDASDGNAASRRKTRLVSDMDEEQLKRKRQTDRKAQEAMRKRTKSRIESLESELESVRAAAAQREQELLMQVHALREENAMLNARLHQRAQPNGDSHANQDTHPDQVDSSHAAPFRPYSDGASHDPRITPHSVLANFSDYYAAPAEQSEGRELPPTNGGVERHHEIDPQISSADVAGERAEERAGADDGGDAKAAQGWPGLNVQEGQRLG